MRHGLLSYSDGSQRRLVHRYYTTSDAYHENVCAAGKTCCSLPRCKKVSFSLLIGSSSKIPPSPLLLARMPRPRC